ncbi:MAG: DUF3857 and transglutaminase domain-containing protein [Bacteroidetes bacterium]|nr:DUF3857 and transglutaminase domain-containing protein [Bacteroidota bacterium]
MRSVFLSIVLLLSFSFSKASGGDEYNVANIPEALKKNANVIKRMEDSRFVITDANKGKYYYKVAYTILSEAGDKWSYFSEGYDKLMSIESFDGTLFDATGKKIKSLKKGDIKDVSGNDDANLADDNRVKWHSFFYKVYPYTVEYEVEIHFKGTMFLPDWVPQERPVMSVQQSRVMVQAPSANPVHYKMYNYKGEPVISDDKDTKTYTWEVKDINAVVDEYARPAWSTVTTSVFMASESFVMEDYKGSNASWKDFGHFVYDLKKDRDQLPDDVKQKVHELTDKLSDEKDKIRVLYDYMQHNTRYISVQLGIGGWQPYDAKYVAKNKYGDCKALANFMFSLLKEAGVKSYYTLVKAGEGEDDIITDLPSSQFNHVILCVPVKADTMWLECTSQTVAPGYMGGFTGNRHALLVDEDGGHLVETPRYGIKDNLEIRHVKAKLEDDATLTVVANTSYKAIQSDERHGLINSLSKDKIKEYLHDDLDFATYDITSFDYKENKNELPVVDETLNIEVSNYATITGKRLFILPNVMTRTHRKLKLDEERKYSISLDFPFRDVDTVEIEIPAGYSIESMPSDVDLKTKFGTYSCKTKLADNKIVYYRTREQYQGLFPAKDYPALVEFYDAIYKADRNKLVMVKKDSD